jgi:bacteriocin biosynthesis cyclodehydratase domain-containing protein
MRAGALLRARSRVPVVVSHDRAPRSARTCRDLLAQAGVATGADGPVLHVARTEVDRDLTDAWMRADRAHLLVTLADGIVRVGPFVVPGQTACVRCVDAHHTELDPRRSLVLHQYAGRTPRVGLPDPVPHDLLELALVWAVRDLVNWIDGRRPRCWSATLQVDPRLELAVTPWPVHAGCGCAWGRRFAG